MMTTPQYATAFLIAASVACAHPSPAAKPAHALRFLPTDTVTIDTVAPDIVHYRVRRPTGPFNIQIVTVPVHSRYEFTAARALDSLRGRERVTDMVRRHRQRGEEIPVALNADFFDLEGKTGINENNQVIEGKVWKANPVTDSPFDTFRSSHTQFAVGGDGRPYIDRFSYAGTITGACGRFVLDGINTVPRVPDALVLFSHAYSGGSRRDSVHVPRELAVRTSATSGFGLGELTLRVDTAAPTPRAVVTRVDSGWAVLAAYGAASARLDSIARCGQRLTLAHDFTPRRGNLTMIIGGWPRVVRDGRNVGGMADSLEGTFPRFSAQRHPRSAIGFSRDSGTVYLVAVDGRQETSDGMSLAELGDFLVSIGVYQGMNFDGGGSTTLVINGRLANRPSDAAGERPVGNAILIRVRHGS